jgi:hypothetical protein
MPFQPLAVAASTSERAAAAATQQAAADATQHTAAEAQGADESAAADSPSDTAAASDPIQDIIKKAVQSQVAALSEVIAASLLLLAVALDMIAGRS